MGAADVNIAARRLKERADYFFGSDRRRRWQVTNFLRTLEGLGDVAVVGGLLRDLLLTGNRDFRSDVDFVVHCHPGMALDDVVRKLGGVPNRFGGYAIDLGHWRADVWDLQTTWAAREGHVDVNSLEDIIKTTFFDWDAVLYITKQRRIVSSKTFFRNVISRVIDLNLEINPNPLGNAVRALRYAVQWEAAIGPSLARHVRGQIDAAGWRALVDAERRSFRTERLEPFDIVALRDRLDMAIETGRPAIVHRSQHQTSLPLPEDHGSAVGSAKAPLTCRATYRSATIERRRRREAALAELQGRLAELDVL